MKRREVLEKARDIVTGARDLEYGGPEDSFARIAKLWTAWLGIPVSLEDVAVMMGLLKMARLASSGYQSTDSWIDIAGYAACGAEIATERRPDDEEHAD